MGTKSTSQPNLCNLMDRSIRKEEMNMDLGLKGKKAIVTDGTRGSSV